MNGNIHNGGLVLQVRDGLWITDIEQYTGTRKLHEDKAIALDGLCWFMNEQNGYLYYSDQKRGHSLNRMQLDGQLAKVLIEEPCYGILLDGDWLYYINEQSRRLYRCTVEGKHAARLIDDQIDCFVLNGDYIFYSTPQGIHRCGQAGGDRETLAEAAASMLIVIGDQLVFADRLNHYTLTVLDVRDERKFTIDGIRTISLNTDGQYIYCANKLNLSSIYRVDLARGSSIRICSEPADYLHVLQHELLFCKQRQWHRLSLLGGDAEPIRMM